MRGWFSRGLAAIGLAMCVASPALAEKRVALVVGNNDYRNVPKLQKAVNDARTMGDTLKQLGFTVMVAENQNRQGFSETLLAFDRAVDAGDTAFFFFAGHGFEIAGQNFLLPTDVPAATEGQEELVRDASIQADRIIERLQNRKVRTAILVFDACRNNPFERAGTRAVAGARRPCADDAVARGRVLDLLGRAAADGARPAVQRRRQSRTRCSRAPSPRRLRSPAPTWCRSRSARGARSANSPTPSATSRCRSISTRWSTMSS